MNSRNRRAYEIQLLGTRFSLQTDEDSAYINHLINELTKRTNALENSVPDGNPLKTSILAHLMTIDELEKLKHNKHTGPDTETQEIEIIRDRILKKLDKALEDINPAVFGRGV